MKISKITADVAAMLGESLLLECETEESPFPDFTSRVRLLIPEVMSELYMTTPKILLTGWKPFPGKLKTDASNGIATLPVPNDYFMLGSIRLSGWSRSVDEVVTPDSPLLAGVGSGITGVIPDRFRPAVVEEIATDGSRCLRLYGAAEDATVATATYMPIPSVSEDSLEVSAALYPQLISKIAEKLND